MSFNRLQYDTCAYKNDLKESMSVGCYQMYAGKYDNKNNCRIDFGIIGGNEVSLYKGNMVDLESDLRGQTRPSSLCPSHKFMPRCKQPPTSGLPSGPIDCQSELVNLPTCQMICYKPVTYAPNPTSSFCPGLYETKGREHFSTPVKEGFCQGCSDGNFGKNDYPKWTPLPGKPCPYASPAPLPERCMRCKMPNILCACK